MLSAAEIENHYRGLPQDQLNVILELRNIICSAAPDATEEIRPRGLVYYRAALGGPVSAGICQINLYHGELRLAFNLGAFLPDPDGLLRQDGKRIAKRFICLGDFDSIPWGAIEELINASSAFEAQKYFAEYHK
jgi:hypothetical protein